MPRPPHGYQNRAGQQVPGVTDITNSYCPKPALVQWAYGRGKQGLPLYERGVLDIGTVVHAMAELDLKGRPNREIEAKPHEMLFEPADVAKAWLAFEAFCRWREQHSVRSIAHEVSLVSETWQLGGTPDCIAYVDGELGLLDFKSCTKAPAKPYDEQLMAMAAHATLWNEHNPKQTVRACHIIYLPKDGTAHKHHAHANCAAQWEEFSHLLRAFQAKHNLPKGRAASEPVASKPVAAEPLSLKPTAPPPPFSLELTPLPRPRKSAAQLNTAQRLLPLVSFVR